MSRRTVRGPLREMRRFARKAIGMSRHVFDAPARSSVTRRADHALRFLVMAVGEAAKLFSPEVCGAHPEITWVDVISMRNRLAHAYDQISRETLHDTIALYLPKLVGQLDTILGDE